MKQTEKWNEILKESNEMQKTLEERRPLANTNVEWSQVQLNLLAQGQKFIPTPKKVDRVQKFKDFLSFARKLRLAIFFHRRLQEGGVYKIRIPGENHWKN